MKARQQDGTRRIALSGEMYKALCASLTRFYRQTKCGVVMLCDSSGLAIAQRGRLQGQEMSLLSSLAAGNYVATAEMAKLLGEENGFRVVFHEGKDNSIYITDVNEDFFLVVVFLKILNACLTMLRQATSQKRMTP